MIVFDLKESINKKALCGEIEKTCGKCLKRPAQKLILMSNGRKQWQCDLCHQRKNVSGFKRRPE